MITGHSTINTHPFRDEKRRIFVRRVFTAEPAKLVDLLVCEEDIVKHLDFRIKTPPSDQHRCSPANVPFSWIIYIFPQRPGSAFLDHSLSKMNDLTETAHSTATTKISNPNDSNEFNSKRAKCNFRGNHRPLASLVARRILW